MTFFIALGVLVAAASAYLLHQFTSGDLSAEQPTDGAADEQPQESLKAA
jgi:hypothetical protein